jgi:DedD protein
VLVMIAVILIPMILDDRSEREIAITETNIPQRPKDNFNSRIVPLQESELTPISENPATEELDAEPLLDLMTEEQVSMETLPEQAEAVEEQITKKEINKVSEKRLPASNMGATAWVVQLGSFSSEENAKGLKDKLRKSGYPAFVEPVNRKSGIAYRVRVGPEILRSDAEQLRQKLQETMQIKGIVIRYP